jgi:hypothetical protein
MTNKESAKECIVNTLKEWSTQDNRCTRFPYYVTVRDWVTEYKESLSGDYIYSEDDAEIIPIKDVLKEIWEYDDSTIKDELYIDSIEQLEELDFFELGYYMKQTVYEILNRHGYNTVHLFEKVEVPKDYGVFLTISDAENHIKCASNHYENPNTYINCLTPWGRSSDTEKFFKSLFEYFEIPMEK